MKEVYAKLLSNPTEILEGDRIVAMATVINYEDVNMQINNLKMNKRDAESNQSWLKDMQTKNKSIVALYEDRSMIGNNDLSVEIEIDCEKEKVVDWHYI